MTAVDWLIVTLRVALPALIFPVLVIPITWIERRGAAFIQDRLGPNRVGPFGLLQAVADMVKMFTKEAVTPAAADRPLFLLAPAIAAFAALSTFAVVPYGATLPIGGRQIELIGADVSIGVLYVFAITSLSVYAIVLAGWSSNNKFSLMGGIRSSAQIISYELAMTTAAAGVILAASSFRLNDVVALQEGCGWGSSPAGTSSCSHSASSSSSSPPSPRRTGCRSTCRRPSPSSSRGTTPSTRRCASAPSRWPSTSTSSSPRR